MLRRLAEHLRRSAAGRNLAIDLVEQHGEHALEILDGAIESCGSREGARRILGVARREIVALLPLLPAHSERWAISSAQASPRPFG